MKRLTALGIATYSLCLCLLLLAFGCRTPARMRTPERYERGIVFILPGIEGTSVWNRDIAIGLDAGGVNAAIEVYDWTTGLPGGFVFNLTDLERNQRQARKLAERIVEHREQHPGSAVYLIGHSGGGGVAVLAIEALPPGRQIDMAVLLAPALSRNYDLTTALRRTRRGIVNFYSEKDVGFLVLGTSLFGAIDREYGASAGAKGFVTPRGLPRADQRIYSSRLQQIGWDERLERYGASGGHLGWASQKFAREFLAPLILRGAE